MTKVKRMILLHSSRPNDGGGVGGDGGGGGDLGGGEWDIDMVTGKQRLRSCSTVHIFVSISTIWFTSSLILFFKAPVSMHRGQIPFEGQNYFLGLSLIWVWNTCKTPWQCTPLHVLPAPPHVPQSHPQSGFQTKLLICFQLNFKSGLDSCASPHVLQAPRCKTTLNCTCFCVFAVRDALLQIATCSLYLGIACLGHELLKS